MSIVPADVRPRLLCAEDRYTPPAGGRSATAAEAVVERFWQHRSNAPGHMLGHPRGPWPSGVAAGPQAHAYVNHGRWMVDCPHGCGSAQYASHADRRFFCVDCAGSSPEWVPVAWPEPAAVAAIEAALIARPAEAARNWQPGETVAELLAENAARGVG